MTQETASSNHAEWRIFWLRWLLIIGSVMVLAAGSNAALGISEPVSQVMLSAIIALGVYNVLVALVLLAGVQGSMMFAITTALDTFFAVVLFWASGRSTLMLVGAGILPILVASLRFGSVFGLLLTAIMGIGDFGILAFTGELSSRIAVTIPSVLFLFMAAALLSFLASTPDRDTQLTGPEPDQEGNRETNAAHERARAIYEMANTLGATLDYNRVLDAALDVGALGLKEMGAEPRLIGMVLLFEKDELRVATSRRLMRQDEKQRVAGKQGILGMALKQAEVVFADDVSDDPELKYFAAFQEAKSVLVIPLRAGFDSYGLLVFGTAQAKAFSDEHIELLTAIGTQATIALQNAVLYQNLREEKERIVEVEEDARKKLARDLHDGPTQSVAAIAMRVNYIRRLIEKKPDEADGELQKVEELARKTTKEIRHMLFTLRPLVLETQGLAPALQQFALKVKETHDLDVTVQIQQGADDLLESHAQGVLFYIVEEAVGNARKHAQAVHIWVRLYRRESYVVVEIQDDGVGFDVEGVNTNYDQRGSLGMVNMRERAALVDGIIRVESAKGKGTKISVLVPVKAGTPQHEPSRDTQPKRPQSQGQLENNRPSVNLPNPNPKSG